MNKEIDLFNEIELFFCHIERKDHFLICSEQIKRWNSDFSVLYSFLSFFVFFAFFVAKSKKKRRTQSLLI